MPPKKRKDQKGKNKTKKSVSTLSKFDSSDSESQSDNDSPQRGRSKRLDAVKSRIEDLDGLIPKTNETSGTKAVKESRTKIIKELETWNKPEDITFARVESIEGELRRTDDSFDKFRARIEDLKKILDPEEIEVDETNIDELEDILETIKGGNKEALKNMVMADDDENILRARKTRKKWLDSLQNIKDNALEEEVSNYILAILETADDLSLGERNSFLEDIKSLDVSDIIAPEEFTDILKLTYLSSEGIVLPDKVLSQLFNRSNSPLIEDIEKVQEKYGTWLNVIDFLNKFDDIKSEISKVSINDVLDQTENYTANLQAYVAELPNRSKTRLSVHFNNENSVGAVAVVGSEVTTSKAHTNATNPSKWYSADVNTTMDSIRNAHGGRIHLELEQRIKERLERIVEQTKDILERHPGKTFDDVVKLGGADGTRLKEIKQNGTPGMHAEVIAANEALLKAPRHLQQDISKLVLAVMQPKNPSQGALEAAESEEKKSQLKQELENKQGEDKPCCLNCRFILSGATRYTPDNFLTGEDDPEDWGVTNVDEQNG